MHILAETAPQYYMGMGHTAEQVAQKYGVSRADQDAFAVRSHELAAAAIAAGKFNDDIVPVEVMNILLMKTIKHKRRNFYSKWMKVFVLVQLSKHLAKLRPAFNVRGSVTAGNASQTSDGAGAVLVMDREVAEAQGLKPLAKFRSFAVGGVPPELMGIGPIVAVPKALKLAGLINRRY